jgi:hypothetical protein
LPIATGAIFRLYPAKPVLSLFVYRVSSPGLETILLDRDCGRTAWKQKFKGEVCCEEVGSLWSGGLPAKRLTLLIKAVAKKDS